jgi:mannose-1-phosphate guanylyltransferase
MLPAMVLAAGLGTRLRPLTDHRAKPLVPVGDRPALAHVLERLHAAGVSRAVVNAHHHTDQVSAFVRAVAWDVRVSEERDLLGTAGGIAHAGGLLGEGDVLVWNADILADVDVRALVAAHGRRPSEATLLVQPMDAGQGAVGVDADGRIVRLRTERFGDEHEGGQFLGVHVLGAAVRRRAPPIGGLIEDVLIPALARGETLRVHPFEGQWHDIGTVDSYLAANVAWLEARGAASWVALGATVAAGVALDRAVVGEGATVSGSGAVVRSVVWSGAHATAPLDGAVVTS